MKAPYSMFDFGTTSPIQWPFENRTEIEHSIRENSSKQISINDYAEVIPTDDVGKSA